MVRRLSLALPAIAVLAAALFAALYLLTALPRIFYPYDLDFIEDSQLMQSLRFAQRQPVYIAPSVEFVPHVYMPFYTWVSGLLLRIFGVGYGPLRLLSFGATLATAGLIFYLARRESGPGWLAWVCAGLYLGGYRLTGFWYELARVDSLFVALSLIGLTLGLYIRPEGPVHVRQSLAAVILALAFFTKQTALAFGACVAVYLAITLGWRGWLFSGILASLIAGGVLALNALTGGWFVYHTFLVASADRVELGRVFRYLGVELFGLMAGLSLMAAAAAFWGWRRSGLAALRHQPWLLAIGAAILVSGAGRASVGGNVNNLMPAYALLCLAPALLWKALGPAAPSFGRWRLGKQTAIAALALSQFALGVYNPMRYIPSAAMRESGDRLIARLRSIEGEVLVLMHPYYAWLAGKAPAAQIATLWYLRAWSGVPLPQDFVDRIRGRYYAAIVSSGSLFETDPEISGLIETYYVKRETLQAHEAPPTLTGMVVRPEAVYVPKRRLQSHLTEATKMPSSVRMKSTKTNPTEEGNDEL